MGRMRTFSYAKRYLVFKRDHWFLTMFSILITFDLLKVTFYFVPWWSTIKPPFGRRFVTFSKHPKQIQKQYLHEWELFSASLHLISWMMLVYLPFIAVCSCHDSGCPVHKIVCVGSKNHGHREGLLVFKKASGCILKIYECTLLSNMFPLWYLYFSMKEHMIRLMLGQLSNEKTTGCWEYKGDDKLPSYVGITS